MFSLSVPLSLNLQMFTNPEALHTQYLGVIDKLLAIDYQFNFQFLFPPGRSWWVRSKVLTVGLKILTVGLHSWFTWLFKIHYMNVNSGVFERGLLGYHSTIMVLITSEILRVLRVL